MPDTPRTPRPAPSGGPLDLLRQRRSRPVAILLLLVVLALLLALLPTPAGTPWLASALAGICALTAWGVAAPLAHRELESGWHSPLWLPVAGGSWALLHGVVSLATHVLGNEGPTAAPAAAGAFTAATVAAALAGATPWAASTFRGGLTRMLLTRRRVLPPVATRIVEEAGTRRRVVVPRAELEVGDEVHVRAGQVLPADLRLAEGGSVVTLRRITGRRDAHPVLPGDLVVAGAAPKRALQGTVVRTGADLALARVLLPTEQVIARARGPLTPRGAGPGPGTLPIQAGTESAARWAVPLLGVLAVVAGLTWGLTAGPEKGAAVATAVLLAGSPAALLLTVPSAVQASAVRGALRGLRLKGTRPLRSAREIDLALVDPSSAIATGHPRLVEVLPVDGLSPDAALLSALSVAQGTDGPLSRALGAAARKRRMTPRPITDREILPGGGLRARIKGTEVTLGPARHFEDVPPALRPDPEDDALITYVAWGGAPKALLRFRDRLRPGVAEEVQRLLRADVVPHLVCAEPAGAARTLAERVGVHESEVSAGLEDGQRGKVVHDMLDEGHRVALLARDTPDPGAEHADLVVASTWSDPANRELAQVETVHPEMSTIADTVAITRHTGAVIGQNVLLVAAYHVIVLVFVLLGWIPAAVAGLMSLLPLAGVLLGSHRLTTDESAHL
ncbi:Cation transport ATPase [Kytococcus aerolatus]|uniref:Cation transport ATPase n=1 Tax=Kytococcus aerolatus TaxID=592308 RepID=A0A212TF23_9MICO|nr:cation-translocating P-type ATPase [Kytococcus aerolatus]SNC64603.1 Cation transport ATPase [Kytococcus aerolatus]